MKNNNDIKEQLLSDEGHNAIAYHMDESNAMVDKLEKREADTNTELVVVPDEARGDMKMPLRVLYEQDKISVSKLPIWYMQALGSMTVKEYNDFVKSHANELNINEIIASDLLQKVLAKDEVATARFWDLQKALLKSKNVVQQINNITVQRDDTVRNLLDDISDGLFNR